MKVTRISIKPPRCRQPLKSYAVGVSAGFPSPADDYIQDSIDLNEHLIKHPNATFLARANGSSMVDLGIQDGDLLIVDRSLTANNGDVVIAALNGELTCKILDKTNSRLLSANQVYPPIKLNEDMDILIEGVVTNSIRYHRVCTG